MAAELTSGTSQLELEINTEAIRKHVGDLGKMLTTNNEMRDRIRNIIRQEIKKARADISKDIRNNLGSDPRKAYRAVRSTIYKQVLGGNINILAPRKAGARYMLIRQRTLKDGQWGGVLRFNNSGTGQRHISIGPNARLGGNRGSIAGRGVFSTSAMYHLQDMSKAISEAFEQEFVNAWNEL